MMRVVFFGTPFIAASVLEKLVEERIEIVAIVTKPDRPQGRSSKLIPCAVKEYAAGHLPQVPLFQPPTISTEENRDLLASFKPDLFVVVAYGEIIKEFILNIPLLGAINLHASLLPKYRGAAPIQRVLMEGETKTGVSIIQMVKKMDAGDVYEEAPISIGEEMQQSDLEQEIIKVGASALLKTINALENGSAVKIPQDHSLATFAPKVELEECEVRWNRSARELHNLIRAVSREPGAWCTIELKGVRQRLRLFKSVIRKEVNLKSGEILRTKNEIIAGTGTDALQILELQPEGKKRMLASDWLRGNPEFQFVV